MAVARAKYSLPLIVLLDPDLMIDILKIEFSEQFCSTKAIQDLID